jgi:uncharacterized protein YbaR (Trm112 family)/SAM-dependent methyltransferase
MKLSESSRRLLCCPICKSRLHTADTTLVCSSSDCGRSFPVVEGVPILINESASLFSIEDFVNRRSTTYRPVAMSKLKLFIVGLLPELSRNLKSSSNLKRFFRLLLEQSPTPNVLVVGGGVTGEGPRDGMQRGSIELVETDVAFGPRTVVICDAHDLPFEDSSFDGLIISAVLEHVLDPYRCVEEIHRTLKRDGLVYAETAFMQQVHGGRYDFTRFTHLGHRRLFRKFDEISSGAVSGPGTALAWAYQYFLFSFVSAPRARSWMQLLARVTGFWWKYFDPLLIDKPGTLDAASGYFFMGRRSDHALSDRELVQLYRGTVGQFVRPQRLQ